MPEIETSPMPRYQVHDHSEAVSHEEPVSVPLSMATTEISQLHLMQSPDRQPIMRIPRELIGKICGYLTNGEIKKLRLTCKELSVASELIIERVFISPDKKILEVFYGILNTPKLAARVKEIVWDDSVMKCFDGGEGRRRADFP